MCALTVQHLVSVVVLLPNTEEPGQCTARRVCPTRSAEDSLPSGFLWGQRGVQSSPGMRTHDL